MASLGHIAQQRQSLKIQDSGATGVLFAFKQTSKVEFRLKIRLSYVRQPILRFESKYFLFKIDTLDQHILC